MVHLVCLPKAWNNTGGIANQEKEQGHSDTSTTEIGKNILE